MTVLVALGEQVLHTLDDLDIELLPPAAPAPLVYAGTGEIDYAHFGMWSYSTVSYEAARTGPPDGIPGWSGMTVGQTVDEWGYGVYYGLVQVDVSEVDPPLKAMLRLRNDGYGPVDPIAIEARLYDWGGDPTEAVWVPGDELSDLPLLSTATVQQQGQFGGENTNFAATPELAAAVTAARNGSGWLRMLICATDTTLGVPPTDDTPPRFHSEGHPTEFSRPYIVAYYVKQAMGRGRVVDTTVLDIFGEDTPPGMGQGTVNVTDLVHNYPTAYVLNSPTRIEPADHERIGDTAKRNIAKWFAHIPVGLDLLRIDGQYVTTGAATATQIAAADRWWQGGYRHELSYADAHALIDAGFDVDFEVRKEHP